MEGGQGLNNIFHFSKALAYKILWKGLMGLGLWREILIQKYIHPFLVLDWIRVPKKV
jgi:hypothetical protein